MRLVIVALACALLTGSVREPEPEPPTVVCSWPEECAYGWAVRWKLNGIATTSQHETPEQALRLYAVLMAVERGGRHAVE